MKKACIFFFLLFFIGLAHGQELFKGKASKAYVMKFKNEAKMKAGKQSVIIWLKDTGIEIKDGGKTLVIGDKRYQKKELHYLSEVDKIYGLDHQADFSWRNEQNWQFNYEVVDSGFYVVITEKLGEQFQMTVYQLGNRKHYFDLIKKSSLTH